MVSLRTFLTTLLVIAIGVIAPLGTVAAQASQLSPAERARLEKELKDLESQIREQEGILNTQKQKTASLQRDLDIVNAKITRAQLNIKAKNVEIQQLTQSIGTKDKEIGQLENDIDDRRQHLSAYVARAARYGDMAYADLLLKGGTLSEVFEGADQYRSLQARMIEASQELEGLKVEAVDQRETLSTQRDAVSAKRAEIEQEKKEIERLQAEHKRLVNSSKQQENSYATVLADRKAKAQAIRAQLFNLRDSDAIPFGRAYDLALKAQQQTGVRPAFLLAILMQESALGTNVGSCYVTNFETGDGKGRNTGTPYAKVMHPTRDVPHFKRITANLGRETETTRVSCPLSYGWGGAMGPAQFIPSTWAIFEARIEKATGASQADPWNPDHAILASAMYLSDLGARSQTYEGERNAACKYYSGVACAVRATSAQYGNSVMAKAANIQRTMIDPLKDE